MKKFAAFDIDGTLIRWQLYHAVVDRLAKQKLLGEEAHDALRQARMKWKRREHNESFREYEQILINTYEAALQQLSSTAFDETVKNISQEYKEQVYTFTRDLARSLKKDGYMLLAISGSQQEVVERVAALYDFDDCVGTQYERSGQAFSGKRFLASHDKKKVLQNLIKKHQLTLKDSIAVGDSASDAPMLEMVENPIAFNPDQSLLKIAQKHGWKIVVERKNVIYQLEKQGSHYVWQA